MSINAIGNQNSLSWQTALNSQNTIANATGTTTASIGAAGSLELSSTGTATVAAVQSGSSSGSTDAATQSCPLGNTTCIGCGQCGKVTAQNALKNQQNGAAAITSSSADYATNTAIAAYESN